jgi:hypothetical protein
MTLSHSAKTVATQCLVNDIKILKLVIKALKKEKATLWNVSTKDTEQGRSYHDDYKRVRNRLQTVRRRMIKLENAIKEMK